MHVYMQDIRIYIHTYIRTYIHTYTCAYIKNMHTRFMFTYTHTNKCPKMPTLTTHAATARHADSVLCKKTALSPQSPASTRSNTIRAYTHAPAHAPMAADIKSRERMHDT